MERLKIMDSSEKNGSGHGQVHSFADLFADLRKMINNAEFSDLRFVCEDRVHVHASRLLVKARCPVLKNMLRSNERDITLPDVSSSALLSILEFLYTGTMVEHAPTSSRKAYELISASRYFQLQKVEDIVREFLLNSTAEIVDDVNKAALRLSVAMEFGTLTRSMDSLPLALVRILNAKELEPIHLRDLSEKAFQFFLKCTQSTEDPQTPSIGEYLRFRLIILWLATQVCPAEAKEIVDSCLPDARSAFLVLQDSQKFGLLRPREEAGREFAYLKSLLVRKNESVNQLESFMRLLDFRRIHAELLAAVIEPLKIVLPSELMVAFRFQALHRNPPLTKSTLSSQYQWEHGTSYCTSGDGSILAKTKPEVGFARFSVPIARSDCIYQWDVVVEDLCHEFCEIGLHNVDGMRDGKPNFTGRPLSEQLNGWALRSDVEKRKTRTRITIRKSTDEFGWAHFGKDFARLNARVRVQLDMFDRTCSFSVDGDPFLVAWRKLPLGLYFPSVSLGAGTTGRVRIELVNGFDIV